uniref:Uncharacterized protein n=1 Tax=Cacopsylla melanoneura TaxID=428564 RepID=A0A8D9BXI7_9HEMI
MEQLGLEQLGQTIEEQLGQGHSIVAQQGRELSTEAQLEQLVHSKLWVLERQGHSRTVELEHSIELGRGWGHSIVELGQVLGRVRLGGTCSVSPSSRHHRRWDGIDPPRCCRPHCTVLEQMELSLVVLEPVGLLEQVLGAPQGRRVGHHQRLGTRSYQRCK